MRMADEGGLHCWCTEWASFYVSSHLSRRVLRKYSMRDRGVSNDSFFSCESRRSTTGLSNLAWVRFRTSAFCSIFERRPDSSNPWSVKITKVNINTLIIKRFNFEVWWYLLNYFMFEPDGQTWKWSRTGKGCFLVHAKALTTVHEPLVSTLNTFKHHQHESCWMREGAR